MSTIKLLIVLYLILICLFQAQAEEIEDSLHFTNPVERSLSNPYKLRLTSVVIPTVVVGFCALSAKNEWLNRQKENIQGTITRRSGEQIKVDNYLQYSQIVSVYGLNLIGLKGKHSFKDRTIILAMSYATMGLIVNSMKYSFRERRPDGSTNNSFPSGHTATAFMGAEFLYKEYKDVSPWIGYTGYAIAATTGYLRIYNNRHYLNDVIAGACIGMMSTKLSYWLYPKIFKKSANKKDESKPVIAGMPYYSNGEMGINMNIVF